MNIRDIIILVLIAGAGIYVWVCEGAKERHAVFVAKVEVEGKAAKQAADKREKDDKKAKEKADAERKNLLADNKRLAAELRDARAARSFVPPAPTGASRPHLAAFDRAELERAVQRLDGGVSGLIATGDEARIDLDNAKRWAATTLK